MLITHSCHCQVTFTYDGKSVSTPGMNVGCVHIIYNTPERYFSNTKTSNALLYRVNNLAITLAHNVPERGLILTVYIKCMQEAMFVNALLGQLPRVCNNSYICARGCGEVG